MKYGLNACSIITPMAMWYKPERLPTLWKEIDKFLKLGKVFSIKEVANELRSDVTEAWAKERRKRHSLQMIFHS